MFAVLGSIMMNHLRFSDQDKAYWKAAVKAWNNSKDELAMVMDKIYQADMMKEFKKESNGKGDRE